MKILLVTNRYPRDPSDPAAPFVPDFVRAVRTSGAQVLVSTPLYGAPIGYADDDVYRFQFDNQIIEAPIGSWNIYHPGTWRRIHTFVHAGEIAVAELAERFQIDHILALWALPSGWFAQYAARRLDIPYSVWCLGSDINVWARRPFFRGITRKILRGAAAVFADGFALARDASRLTGAPCHFLPSCHLLVQPPEAKLIDTGLPKKPYFLYAGRMHRGKGIYDLLRAFQITCCDLSDHQLVYAGDGPDLARLREVAANTEYPARVHILGQVSEQKLVALYRNAKATVIPSYSDSLPLVLSESLQCKCPLLVYETGDLGHFVRRFKIGRTVPVGNLQALADAMCGMATYKKFDERRGQVAVDLLHPMRAARRFLKTINSRVTKETWKTRSRKHV